MYLNIGSTWYMVFEVKKSAKQYCFILHLCTVKLTEVYKL